MEIGILWMPILLAGLVVLAVGMVALVLWRRRRRREKEALPVAHSDRLTRLPGYRRLLRRYRAVLGGLVAVTIVATLAAGAVASRPVTSVVENSDRFTRDIVLCLDVSGSMAQVDARIVDRFGEFAERFAGERIGLVVWDSSSVQVFPLTDDYDYLTAELERVKASLETDRYAEREADIDSYVFEGTGIAEGASLIGDGLASCVLRFDRLGDERSRSIILATDNMVNGDPLVTLTEAGEFAAERGVRVYGLNPAEDYAPLEAREFQTVMEGTEGAYFAFDDPGSVSTIVDRVLSEDATHLRGAPELIYYDEPAIPLLIVTIAFGLLLLLAWRVRL